MLYQYREESDEVTVPTKHYWCDPTRVRDHDPDTPACLGGLSVPDLTDPATVGCLLALVRSAYSDPWFYVRPSHTYRPDGVLGWECFGYLPGRDGGSWRGSGYASEVEALVAALEAAP